MKKLKILACGGRYYCDKSFLFSVLDKIAEKYPYPTYTIVIIEGEQTGADILAKDWAKSNNFKHLPFPADWTKFGNKAGYLRNAQMLAEGRPDLVVAFPGGKGTNMMINLAKEINVKVIDCRNGELSSVLSVLGNGCCGAF